LCNSSYNYEKSEYFNEDVAINISNTEDMMTLAKLTLDYLDKEYNIIIDVGGGADAINVSNMLSKTNFQVKYIIPVSKSLKSLKNVLETIELIGKDKEIYFVLNQVVDPKKIEDEFMFFYGNKKREIKSFKERFDNYKFTSLPYSVFYELSDAYGMYIGDLAKLSQNLDFETAANNFREEHIIKDNNNVEAYEQSFASYLNSIDANLVTKQILSNFSVLV